MISLIKKYFGANRTDFIESVLRAGYNISKHHDSLSSSNLFEVRGKSLMGNVFLRENSSDVACFRKIFLENEYGVNLKYAPDFIIDAGANIGLSSIYFATKFPSSKIIALEPEHENYKLLNRNIENHENIIAIQAALWHTATKLNIIDFGKHDNFQVVSDQMLKEDEELIAKIKRYNGRVALRCDSISIDDLISKFEIKRIGLIKMDIEGSEREVFQNSSNWIDVVDAIITELHDRWHPGCEAAFLQNTSSFDSRWVHGESHYISKENQMTPLS